MGQKQQLVRTKQIDRLQERHDEFSPSRSCGTNTKRVIRTQEPDREQVIPRILGL